MSEILVGQFLLRRLKQLGVRSIFGVPGDFELAFLNLVPDEDLSWVGTPNELVGAYAADGYARISGAPGALVTTFGPGELSALCGIAGSFTEFIPVVHIVGYPKTRAMRSGKILHHTLGDLDYGHYLRMSDEISCATTVLKDDGTAAAEIDRVLNAMIYHSRPVYIGISEDVAYSKLPSSILDGPLTTQPLPRDLETEDRAIKQIITQIESAKHPILMVDGGAARSSWEHLVGDLSSALRIPVFNTILGKGIANEQDELYGGLFIGGATEPAIKEAVEGSDCVLWLGRFESDLNTGMFTGHVAEENVIDFQRFHIKAGETEYLANISHILLKLTRAVKASTQPSTRRSSTHLSAISRVARPNIIEQDYLWDRLSAYLQPGDLVITEVGTTQVGFQQTKLPAGSTNITSPVWASIGFATGAAVGASIAAKEKGSYKRLVLITGEGSIQLTIQALALLNRHGIVPVVFIINNAGYTIERFFDGWQAEYNNVPLWDYGMLFKGLSPNVKTKAFRVTTAQALDELLLDQEFQKAEYPQCVDLIMDWKDAPRTMRNLFKARG